MSSASNTALIVRGKGTVMNVLLLVQVDRKRAPRQIREIWNMRPCLFSFFPENAYWSDPWVNFWRTMAQTRWITQGSVFWGLARWPTFMGSNSPKPVIRTWLGNFKPYRAKVKMSISLKLATESNEILKQTSAKKSLCGGLKCRQHNYKMVINAILDFRKIANRLGSTFTRRCKMPPGNRSRDQNVIWPKFTSGRHSGFH